MKVISLQAENFKRLKAVEVTPRPDDTLVVVAGRNAQGKSSVLDAVWAALAGPKGMKIEEPVRQGEARARVRVDLGDLVVTRTWPTDGPSRLVVESAAGVQLASPQNVLDQLLGRFSFDPLAFAEAKPADQRAALLDLIGLDLEDFERRRREAYDERTLVNREVKRLQGALKSVPAVPPATPAFEVSVSEVARKARRAHELDQRIENLRAEHVRLTALLEQNVADGRAAVAERCEIPEETEELVRQVDQADEINKHVRNQQHARDLLDESLRQQETSKALTATLEKLEEEKQAAIKSARLPVDGLGFDDTGVTLNGVPLSQASAAERLRTSVAIAMAANPNVRVIRITDGSLLDSENLGLISQMAADHDFQVWVERVDETGQVGIVIEDGEVRS